MSDHGSFGPGRHCDCDICESLRNPDVTTADGGTDLRSLRVGDKVIVNGATMYVSEISDPKTMDGLETLGFELTIMPPDFLAEALYRFERPS